MTPERAIVSVRLCDHLESGVDVVGSGWDIATVGNAKLVVDVDAEGCGKSPRERRGLSNRPRGEARPRAEARPTIERNSAQEDVDVGQHPGIGHDGQPQERRHARVARHGLGRDWTEYDALAVAFLDLNCRRSRRTHGCAPGLFRCCPLRAPLLRFGHGYSTIRDCPPMRIGAQSRQMELCTRTPLGMTCWNTRGWSGGL